jgi:uncharacterized membrane protein SirB2
MIEFYPQIKLVHVAAVAASVALFALRGTFAVAGRERLAQWLPLRCLSWTIDTVLLSAALMLLALLPGAMFANHWLTAKVVLLFAYVMLGSLALRRARSRRARLGFLLAALAVVGFMASIARAHHPLGLFLSAGG